MTEWEQRNYNKILEVANALIESGWEVDSIDFHKNLLTVSRFFAVVEIYIDTYEERISMSEVHHPSCYHYCDNKPEEMVHTILKLINEFRHENYKLTYINEFGQECGHDRFSDRYFPDEKSLLRGLLEEDTNENIHSLEEATHQFPNPAIKKTIKRMRDLEAEEVRKKYYLPNNSLIFEIHRIEYNTEDQGCYSSRKVLDTIKEDKMFYACISFREAK